MDAELRGAAQENAARLDAEDAERELVAAAAAHFGRQVARWRVRRRWSQEELAERAGVDSAHVSRIEGGSRMPSFAVIVRLALALRVAPAELFTTRGR